MRKLLTIIALVSAALVACNDDTKTVWDAYSEWRETNNTWLAKMQAKQNPDGTPYYQTIVRDWDPSTFVLVHYFNDRAETEGNLSPLYTSTVDTRYNLHLCDSTAIDSSTAITTWGPGIFRSPMNQLVPGWYLAMADMRCGDTAEVIVPYAAAYGENGASVIPPYSNLRFNIRLVDIPYYELPDR